MNHSENVSFAITLVVIKKNRICNRNYVIDNLSDTVRFLNFSQSLSDGLVFIPNTGQMLVLTTAKSKSENHYWFAELGVY